MFDFSAYLLIGILLALLLSIRPKWYLLSATIGYWLIITLWSLNLIQPFNFASWHWSESFNINIAYHVDGLAQLFTLLISGIGCLIFLYAHSYTQQDTRKRAKLFSLLQLFAISMLGLVLMDNLIALFLCWELTSITSYLLIQFNGKDSEANQAAFNSLFIAILGGLAMLAGFILLQQQSGSWSMQVSFLQTTAYLNQPLLLTAFALILLGIITKSAQFPFHFWLPGAMKAPTPVSAYLHSATMVNAGIYLLARLHALFGFSDFWYPSMAVFGLSTMLIASVLSLYQRDLKAILAYTTLFALGSMVYLLGSNQWFAAEALGLFLIFHGFYKAAAFMLAGTIDMEYQTRDIHQLDGIARKRPIMAICLIVTFGAMAGLPPFFGFVMKQMMFEAKLADPNISLLPLIITIVSSMLIAAVSLKCLWCLFVGNIKVSPKKFIMAALIGPVVLATIIIVLGFKGTIIGEVVDAAADAVMPSKQMDFISPNTISSAALSLMTQCGGILLFILWVFTRGKAIPYPAALCGKRIFETIIGSILRFGKWFTHITQRQSLSLQLKIMLFALLSLILFCLFPTWSFYIFRTPLPLNNALALLSILLSLTAISLLFTTNILSSLNNFAIFGLALTFLFITQGAIDVATTQLLVEILIIVIVVIALRKAKDQYLHYQPRFNGLNAVIALSIGLAISLLLFTLKYHDMDTQLGDYYLKHSLPLAHGKNVVNVILVDFRALDTMGEVLVILATVIGIVLLTRKNKCRS